MSTASAQINLAPEVYQNSQRDKKRRKLAVTIGTVVSIVAFGVVVAAAIIYAAQSVAVKLLQNSIASDESKIDNYPGLVKAATAQEHLASWKQLNQQKVYLSRFFNVLQRSGMGSASSSLDRAKRPAAQHRRP